MIFCLFIQHWLWKILGWRQHIPGYLLLSPEGWGGVALFSQIYPWWCCQLTPWRHPMLQPRQSACDEIKTFSSHNSASTQPSSRCRGNSVWRLGHYHCASCWLSRLNSVQRVGCFYTSFVFVHICRSDCHDNQIKISYFLQGRLHIRWIIGSWL